MSNPFLFLQRLAFPGGLFQTALTSVSTQDGEGPRHSEESTKNG